MLFGLALRVGMIKCNIVSLKKKRRDCDVSPWREVMCQPSVGDWSVHLAQQSLLPSWVVLKCPGQGLLTASPSHVVEVQVRTYTQHGD